jgi:hypothetical protein
MIPLLALAAGAKIVGALFSYMSESEAREKAQQIYEEAQAKGDLSTKALEDAAQSVLGPSEFAKIKESPEYQQAGADTLAQLDRTVKSGGMTLADKANLNETLNESSRREAMSRAAGEADLARRGALNSGAALALQMGAQQQQANTNADASLRAAGDASMRAYQANLARGQYANQLNQFDYQRQRDRADAQDQNARLQWGRNYQAAQDIYSARTANANRNTDAMAGLARGQGEANARMGTAIGGAVGDAIAGSANEYFKKKEGV